MYETEETRQKEILMVLDRSRKLRQSLATIIDHELKHRNEIRENPDNWDRICSSSNIIDDTIRATENYVKSDYPDKDIRLQYIFIYGLLQALYLQQDAVENLFKVLHRCYPQNQKFLYKRSDELKEVRELRNEITGHPTGTFGGIFTYITREFGKWHFERLRSSKAGGNEFPSVDLFSVLKKQALAIENDLRTLVEKSNEVKKMCYEKYKDRIAVITKRDLEYDIQKVAEGIYYFYLTEQHEYFKEMVEEIDSQYRTDEVIP